MAKGSGAAGKGTSVRGAVSKAAAGAGALTASGVERELTDAMLSLSDGAIRRRVLLSDLRSQVGLTREDFDTVMKSMQREGKIVMYGLDNPLERTKAVEAGALQIAGVPRHVAYLQRKK